MTAMEQGQRVIQTGTEPSGPLRVGSPESILTYRLPPILRTFRQRFPHVELSFRPHLNDTLVTELETGKLDMAICMCDAVPNAVLISAPLQAEEILLLGHASHPLTRKASVQPSDLAEQTLLLTESGCGYRNKLDRILTLQNVRPGNITEFSSVEALKQCVAAAMGVGLLPGIVVARELRQRQFKVAALGWPASQYSNPHLVAQRQMGISGNGRVPRLSAEHSHRHTLVNGVQPRTLTYSQRARYRRCPHRHPIDTGKSACGKSRKLMDKLQHCGIERIGPLQRSEVAYVFEEDEFSARYRPGHIIRVLGSDKFIVLALHNRDGHGDIRKVVRREVRLRSLHQADIFDKSFKALWCN